MFIRRSLGGYSGYRVDSIWLRQVFSMPRKIRLWSQQLKEVSMKVDSGSKLKRV
jgi:hypothetical protein